MTKHHPSKIHYNSNHSKYIIIFSKVLLKRSMCSRVILIVLMCFELNWVKGYITYLTFEVESGHSDCYFEQLDASRHTGYIDFEYTVMQGGSMDIESTLSFKNSNGNEYELIFQSDRNQHHTITHTFNQSGLIQMCFSNEFSTFSDKLVSLELYIEKKPLEQQSEITESQSLHSLDRILESLRPVEHVQWTQKTDSFRLAKVVQQLNERVQWIAALTTCIIVIVMSMEVFLLKRLFTDNKRSFSF